MDRKTDRIQSWSFHLLYISFVFSLVYMFGLGIELELNILKQIFLVAMASSLVKFFLLNPLILYFLLATGSIGGLLANRYINPFLFSLMERVYLLFLNISENLQGKENISLGNIFSFWIILIFLVSFLTAFIIFKNKSINWLLPIYIGFFLYYWYTFFDSSYWMIALFLLSFFIFIGLDRYPKEKTNPFWSKTVITYSILIASLSILLPKTNNYISWPWLQIKIYSIFPMIEDLRYDDPSENHDEASLFDFSITGFQSEPSRLGGPVILNEERIMSVYSDSRNYLRGNVKHTYTGNSWDNSLVAWKGSVVNQDFSKISDEDRKLYYEGSEITITHREFTSTTLFSPYMPTKVTLPGNYPVNQSVDSILVLKKGIYNDENYKIQVEKPLPYGILITLDINRKKEDLDLLDTYLQVPHGKITSRTKTLVKEIVKDAESDFDKARAIETYLRNNYEYDLNVSPVPENKEFIDYFLFEEEKGYCTYYATTMALMLRLEGIPSRYVEGYLAHDLLATGVYEVKQSNAHAWVEAFIEPVGWMTFEATPSIPIESRLEDYEARVNDSEVGLDIDNDTSAIIDENIEDSTMLSDEGFLGGDYEMDEDISNNSPWISLSNIILYLLGILFLIIPIRFIVSFFKYKYQERQVEKMSNENKIIYLYKEILKLMDSLGHRQISGETHFEYASRVAYKLFQYDEKGIIEITEIFVRSKYSGLDTLDEDILDLVIYKESLENKLKNHLGKVNYYYQKYIKIKINI